MRRLVSVVFLTLVAACYSVHAEDMTGRVKKAVERITLNQPGTKPFHLKATIAPTYERDKGSGRTGEVEIWWASPAEWKREIRSREFHQIEIVDDKRDWQKNEGDYFPEWLRETAVEIVQPVPALQDVLAHVKSAKVRNLFGKQINIDWTTNTGTADVHNIRRGSIALNNAGDLLYASGFGWSGEFKDYQRFHERMIARTVNVADETARVTTLENLGDIAPDFFNADANGEDP